MQGTRGSLAEAAWEAATSPHPVEHRRGRYVTEHPFRGYGGAIAWVEWHAAEASLLKIETLPGAPRGSGSDLMKLIQRICDEHELSLQANVSPYRRDADGALIDNLDFAQRLASWYRAHGFQVWDEGAVTHARYTPPRSAT